MSLTGTYAYRDGALVKVSDRIPLRGTHPMATKSFREQAMWGLRRIEEKGGRLPGRLKRAPSIWDRAERLAKHQNS